MTRLRRFANLILFLALPGLLLFSGSSGCKGKQEGDTAQPVPQPQANASTSPAATTPPETVVTTSSGDKGGGSAGISGKVILKGTPPPEKDISLTADCGTHHAAGLKTRFYVVGEHGGLADVFISIKDGLAGKTYDAPSEPVVLDQVGCEYTPYVIGLQTGQKLLVKNSDPLMHNVHSIPRATGNKESNKAQMPRGKELEYAFASPELFVPFKCDIHPWMFAYVGVIDHPFFGVSGNDGKFQLKNVPDGKYVVEAYHRKAGKQTHEITVADGKSAPVEFTFEVPGQ